MRINQVLTSLHLQNMAWWLCTFAKYLGDCDNEFSMGEYSLVCVCVYGFLWVISGYCGLLYYDMFLRVTGEPDWMVTYCYCYTINFIVCFSKLNFRITQPCESYIWVNG
jgi:hypothetical protein